MGAQIYASTQDPTKDRNIAPDLPWDDKGVPKRCHFPIVLGFVRLWSGGMAGSKGSDVGEKDKVKPPTFVTRAADEVQESFKQKKDKERKLMLRFGVSNCRLEAIPQLVSARSMCWEGNLSSFSVIAHTIKTGKRPNV